MKRSFISFIVLAIAISVSAQAPPAFKYQAYLRNADGTIRGNEFVTLQLKIVQGTVNGATVYSEVHNTSTNGHGLVSVSVGEGSTSSNMESVQWGVGPFFLDITVNGIHLGTTELLSVPFALYANETGSSFSGDYDDLTGAPNLARVATTGVYSDLTGRPNLALVATTGSYTSLINIPTTFTPAVHTHLEADISDLAHYTDDDIDGTETAFIGWDMDVSDDFVGDMGGATITNVADPVNPQDAATRAYVDGIGSFSGSFNDLTDVPTTLDRDSTNNLPVDYTSLTNAPAEIGDFGGDMGGATITNLGAPINPTDAVTRAYVDGLPTGFSGSYNDLTDVPVNLDIDATDDFSGSYTDLTNVPANMDTDATDDFDGVYGSLTGAPTQIGDLGGNMGGALITNVADPVAAQDAATRQYVDDLEATVAALQGQVTTLQGQVATLISDLAALTARVDAEHPL